MTALPRFLASRPERPRPAARRPRCRAAWLLAGIGLLGLAAAGPALAQWKWRDARGQINVSDRPPPREVPEKDILARPAPETRRDGAAAATGAASAASAPRSAAPTALQREVEARRRAEQAEQDAKAKAEAAKNAAIRAENCRSARGHLAALDSGQRLTRFNDKGEREIMDDRARALEQLRAREVIQSDCR